MATTTTNTNTLENKTDDEIQAEIVAIKKKFYDRMNVQVEKDLILEERERLDEEKKKLEIQKEFLKQKMSRVYEDEYDKKDFQLKSNTKANNPEDDEEYYDVFKNSSPLRSATQREEPEVEVVPQRRNKWHPEVGKVSGPDLNNIRSNIDNKRPKSNRSQSGIFHDPFADKHIPLVNHYNAVLERSFYLPQIEDDNSQKNKFSKEMNSHGVSKATSASQRNSNKDSSYQPSARLHKTYYNL